MFVTPPIYHVGSGSSSGVRTGRVRAEGRASRDDTGLFHPLGTTFFWAMQDFKGNRPHYDANADWIAVNGFDYVRILCEVGWSGREIDPTQPQWADWGDVLRGVIDDLWRRGVRVELTISGKGTSTYYPQLARDVGAIVADGRHEAVLHLEMQNEYVVGGSDLSELASMAVEVQARTPNLVALSTPVDEADAERVKAEAQRIGIGGFTLHTDRGQGDYGWRMVRQSYDLKNSAPLWASSNEPPGPGSSVNVLTNPLQLAMMRAVGVMCGGSAFVLHTGTGVFGDGKPHPTAGPRPANFWEIDHIDAIVDALRGVDALLPEGCENWQVANTQWQAPNPVAPFQPHHHWEGDSGDGVNKAYSALAPDGRWIQMPCGVRGHAVMTASYSLWDVVVYDPLTHAIVYGPFDIGKGYAFDLPGGGLEANVAYVIHGRR
jgi:hypothetical protein